VTNSKLTLKNIGNNMKDITIELKDGCTILRTYEFELDDEKLYALDQVLCNLETLTKE